jgi:hypothetical protein
VRGLLAALAGLLGLAWWRRRAQTATPDPADELRARLAEAREADDRDEFEAGEKPVDQVPDDVDTRRRDVHERTRRQIDELRGE